MKISPHRRLPAGLTGAAVLATLGAATACGFDSLEAIGPAPGAEDGPSGELPFDASAGRDAGGPAPDATIEEDATPDVAGPGETSLPDSGPSSPACTGAQNPAREWTFDTDPQGWTLAMDTGVVGSLSWAGTTGNPSPGALDVHITAAVDGGANGAWAEYDGTPLGNLSGRTLSAWVWLEAGVSPHLKMFVQTGSQYTWADNGTVDLTPGVWTCVSMDVSSPSYTNGPNYDPTSVVRVGFELLASTPFSLFIDTVAYY